MGSAESGLVKLRATLREQVERREAELSANWDPQHPERGFDEAAYLAANPDVQEAVAQGA